MIRSFWQLQFFLELQGAGRKGYLDTNWLKQDVELLSQSSADGFYNRLISQKEQILTASDFLGAVTSGTITSVETVHDNAYGMPTIRWDEGAVPSGFCAEPLFFECNKDNFKQGPENLDTTPWSYRFYRAMSSTDGWIDGYMMTLVYPFQGWRRYGFAIWDDKRMVDLGMRSPRNGSIVSNSITYSFRWWSILTEEDMG